MGYTGGMMRVPPYGDLVIDLAGLQLSGDPIPILADHDSSLRGIIGHGVARVNAGRLLVQGTLIPGSEATQRIIELNKSGFRFQASVGVAPGIIERVRPGETIRINNRTIQSPQTAFSLVRTGELREISLVALGADASTSVSIAASRNKGFGMTTDNITPTADEIRAEALAETERIAAIRKACGSRYTDIEATAIRDGWDGNCGNRNVVPHDAGRKPGRSSVASAPSGGHAGQAEVRTGGDAGSALERVSGRDCGRRCVQDEDGGTQGRHGPRDRRDRRPGRRGPGSRENGTGRVRLEPKGGRNLAAFKHHGSSPDPGFDLFEPAGERRNSSHHKEKAVRLFCRTARFEEKSGRHDLNVRPPAPKAESDYSRQGGK